MDASPPHAPKASHSGAPLRSTTFSDVISLGAGRYRVQLGGSFGSAWLAVLCSELAARRISIDQARAHRGHDGTWLAQLQVVVLSGAPDAELVPYVELASAAMTRVPGPLSLDMHRVEQVPEHGGTLRLTIEGADSLGLLGSLLGSLATLMLFPVELRIETRRRRAFDTFWLAGVGGSVPSAQAHGALIRLLEGKA